jgi:hypothetical protein
VQCYACLEVTETAVQGFTTLKQPAAVALTTVDVTGSEEEEGLEEVDESPPPTALTTVLADPGAEVAVAVATPPEPSIVLLIFPDDQTLMEFDLAVLMNE